MRWDAFQALMLGWFSYAVVDLLAAVLIGPWLITDTLWASFLALFLGAYRNYRKNEDQLAMGVLAIAMLSIWSGLQNIEWDFAGEWFFALSMIGCLAGMLGALMFQAFGTLDESAADPY